MFCGELPVARLIYPGSFTEQFFFLNRHRKLKKENKWLKLLRLFLYSAMPFHSRVVREKSKGRTTVFDAV